MTWWDSDEDTTIIEEAPEPLDNVKRATALFRLVPDDVILSLASRDFAMTNNARCVCGWVVRETLARIIPAFNPDEDPDNDETVKGDGDSADLCATFYGGDKYEWYWLYEGVMSASLLPDIEFAFSKRIDKAVDGTRLKTVDQTPAGKRFAALLDSDAEIHIPQLTYSQLLGLK